MIYAHSFYALKAREGKVILGNHNQNNGNNPTGELLISCYLEHVCYLCYSVSIFLVGPKIFQSD